MVLLVYSAVESHYSNNASQPPGNAESLNFSTTITRRLLGGFRYIKLPFYALFMLIYKILYYTLSFWEGCSLNFRLILSWFSYVHVDLNNMYARNVLESVVAATYLSADDKFALHYQT